MLGSTAVTFEGMSLVLPIKVRLPWLPYRMSLCMPDSGDTHIPAPVLCIPHAELHAAARALRADGVRVHAGRCCALLDRGGLRLPRLRT